MRRVVLVGAWVLVGGLGTVALARILAFDDNRYLFALNSLTLWLYLPAYVVLVVAIALRRYALAGASLVLVLLHVLWLQSVLHGAEDISREALRSPRVRVFSANLTYDNGARSGIVGEMRRSHADVLVLQELSGGWGRALRRSGLWDAYPHRLLAGKGVAGMGILSKLPLSRPRVTRIPGPPLLEATVRVEGRAVRLFNAHPVPPVFGFDKYRRETAAITRTLSDQQGPVVMAGDLNTSPFNEWMRELDDLGLRDSHEILGRGFATTWPNGFLRSLPVRLDHVLVSDDVVPLRIREGDGEGSDHKPLIADLAVLRSRAR